MDHENSLALSTAQHCVEIRTYLNAADAARHYVSFVESSGFDHTSPVVDGSAPLSCSDRYLMEAALLRHAFLRVRRQPRIPPERWQAWVAVRIYDLTQEAARPVSVRGLDMDWPRRSTVSRWVQYVDKAVDGELDRCGMLASTAQREQAREEGLI